MSAADLTLQVRNLRTHFFTRDGVLPAVDDVSFSLARGRILGLVGESGSGKSVTGFSHHGTGRSARPRWSAARSFPGRDLVRLPARELRKLQGNRIAMVFQDPMMTLQPVLRIEAQMVEAVRAHSGLAAPRPAHTRATRSA